MPIRRPGNVVGKITESMLRQQIDLLRLEAGARRGVIKLIDNMLNELTALLRKGDLTAFSKQRVASLVTQAADTIDSYYSKIHGVTEETLTGVAEASSSHAAKTLDKTFGVVADFEASLPTETYLARIATNATILGAPSEAWWSKQSQDTAFKFGNAVRQGLIAGETNEQIVSRVAGGRGYAGIMDMAKSNARSLVHTSIQEVANESRRETFKKNDDVVEGLRQVSTLDSNTTDICMAYDGAEFDLDGEPINGTDLPYDGGCPRHWGCRSVEVPITKTFAELGVDVPEPADGTRASADGQLPAKTTFADFLDTQSTDQQDEMLGKGRAELWREGTITLQQLLDQKGNPLTLEELKAKYA